MTGNYFPCQEVKFHRIELSAELRLWIVYFLAVSMKNPRIKMVSQWALGVNCSEGERIIN